MSHNSVHTIFSLFVRNKVPKRIFFQKQYTVLRTFEWLPCILVSDNP